MKKTNPPTEMYRQGDVLLVRRDSLPADAAPVPRRKKERVILAHGEATGHHHSLHPDKATLYREKDLPETGIYAGVVEVAEALAALEHQEHAPIPLQKGLYEVRRQVEYHPQEIRRVAD